MSEILDAEMTAALRLLALAQYRVGQQRAVYGGVDRDVTRRLTRALAQVRNLETRAATALLAA
jgi:hypothetical protein